VRVARARLVAIVALVAALAPVSASTAVKGDERVLIVLATAGPTPYGRDEVESVVRSTDAFLRASSFGQVRLHVDVTGWLTAFDTTPGCPWADRSLDSLVAPARLAAGRAGFAPERYERVVYAIADSHCAFHGVTWGHQVMLTRPPTLQLLLHELGHTFGLGHSNVSACAVGCLMYEAADPYSPMGEGATDYSVYEKSLLGWIGPQPHATVARSYVIGRGTLRRDAVQALVINTPIGEWWLEYRTQPFRGLLVRFVSVAPTPPPFSPSAALMLNPTHRDRPWVAAQETYRNEYFLAKLVRAGTNRAEIRFSWAPGRHH
jgi:hypothetical protein